MAPYQVIIENRAQKEFFKLTPPFIGAVKKAITGLEANPRPHGVKKLAGAIGDYRIRVADYRVLYVIDDKKRIVTVFRIRHRKEVYRGI